MNSLFEGEFDHEYYTRIGRQSQAQTAWRLFSGLGSQIKIFFQKDGLSQKLCCKRI